MNLYYSVLRICLLKSPLSSPLHWPLSSQTRALSSLKGNFNDLIEMISKCLCFSYDSPLDVMVEQIPRRKGRPREGANRAKHDRPSASVSAVSDMKKFLCDFCHKRYGTAGSLQVGNIFIICFWYSTVNVNQVHVSTKHREERRAQRVRLMGTSIWFCYVVTFL